MLVLVSFGVARLPTLPRADRDRLAGRFKFTHEALPGWGDASTSRTVRTVHPTLQPISAWISSVGASVALRDLDGDGLPNDVILVDPRSDQVVVAPVPGTPARYPPVHPRPRSRLPTIAATMAPMGCLPGDFNEDGLADVLVYYWGRTPIVFLRKRRARVRPR